MILGRRRSAATDSARPTPPPEPPVDPFLQLVLARTEQVGTELGALVGGASLCSLSRSGGRVEGVKYLEGRMAVLMELSRRIRSDAPVPSELLRVVGSAWRAELVEAQTRDRGPSWIAYRAGGVDEVEELLAGQATGTA